MKNTEMKKKNKTREMRRRKVHYGYKGQCKRYCKACKKAMKTLQEGDIACT